MVLPEYQHQKIGTKIMNKLLEKINQIKLENPYVRVYLGASKGKEEFYKKFEVKERSTKKSFSFGQSKVSTSETVTEEIEENQVHDEIHLFLQSLFSISRHTPQWN